VGAAHAQSVNLIGPDMKLKTQEDVDRDATRNSEYQKTMKKLPDQNVKSDPWGNMRGGGAAQSEQKPKKTQAGVK
jgi:hypothetical protein